MQKAVPLPHLQSHQPGIRQTYCKHLLSVCAATEAKLWRTREVVEVSPTFTIQGVPAAIAGAVLTVSFAAERLAVTAPNAIRVNFTGMC